jgi:predicted nucleotidyltransferase
MNDLSNLDDPNLKIIRQVVEKLLPGCKMYLFGSRARNTNRTDSDYDILMVTEYWMPQEKLDPIRIMMRFRFAQFGLNVSTIIYSASEIRVRSKIKGHTINNIMPDLKEF